MAAVPEVLAEREDLSSFKPRCRTQFTFTGRPCSAAAPIPARTRDTLNPRPFIFPAVVWSRESTETLSRSSPAERRAAAWFPRNQPFVVSETSGTPRCLIDCMIEGRSLLRSGSPPVSRTFCTPRRTNAPTIRNSSSAPMSSPLERKGWSGPKASLGMQYGHLKLHLSVTETRRSLMGRPSVSRVPSM